MFDTLKLIIKVVLNKAKSSESGAAATAQPQAAAPSEAPSPAAMAPPHERVAVPAVQPKSDSAMNAPAVGAQTGTAVQAAPVMSPAPQVESESEPEPVQAANRPFPGNEASTVEERKAPPIGFGQSGSEESSKSSAVTGSEPKASENAAGLPSINSPQMAPSLRRRAEGKKRGFFKRLFGIK
ncbi:MAG: hypothetical protein DRP45_04155 [Candidatus Zixiibacteriota bacterium]|nr:MAG: hypothetical protein DRP45_04155 [candidate division Zixibacteria bacterium]